MARTSFKSALLTAALLSSVLMAPASIAQTPAAAGKEWPTPAGSLNGQRFSSLNQITNENAHKLQVAWTFSTGVLRGHEGAPLVVGDTMFVHAPFPNTVFALDLNNDGKILWKYEPKQDPNVIPVMCCDTVNRGLAYGDGKIFLHQADTTLVALDAKTGNVVWSVKTDDPSKGATGTDAPLVVNDKVYVGVSGGEFGVRGWLAAFNTADGKPVWRGYSIGPDSDTLIQPGKTTHLGKPVAADSSSQAGRATSGRSAAARPGAGSPTIRAPTRCSTARAIPPPGIPSSGRATTNTR